VTRINIATFARSVTSAYARDATCVRTASKVTLHATYTRAYETFLRLLVDESGDALVEYCIVMATLTVLMMLAYRNVGAVANNSVGNSVNNMTNSSVVAP
jgi:Flp pilus assembly pilin Flp